MTASTRFLGFAILAWAGVRAVSLGLVPGSGAVASGLPAAALAATPPGAIAMTEYAPLNPATAPIEAGRAVYEQVSDEAQPYASSSYSRRRHAPRFGRRRAHAEPREYADAYAAPRQSRWRASAAAHSL